MPSLQDRTPVSSQLVTLRQVVLAESDAAYREWMLNALRDWGYEPRPVSCYRQLTSVLADMPAGTVVLIDDGFCDGSHNLNCALATIGRLFLDGFDARVIFCSDRVEEQLEERVLQMGAAGYVTRRDDLSSVRKQLASVVSQAIKPVGGVPFLGDSPAVRELRDVICQIAPTDSTVMITGESGTGKELVARAIHDCSGRSREEFVPVNMAALPETLIESVLFGHEKGAFTGADHRQSGMCEAAHGGSLFLDEICEMPLSLQPKLLRFLQSYRLQRVGSAVQHLVDVRIISATNRDVDELVAQGLLRKDLYYRLHVIPIHLAPLRERRDDIPLLAEAFLKRRCQRSGKKLTFSPRVLERFYEYAWPGNVRQLENVVERLEALARKNVIEMSDLPPEWFFPERRAIPPESVWTGTVLARLDEEIIVGDRLLTRMEIAERSVIIEALNRYEGSASAAAEYLGLGQATIYRKIRTLDIPKSVMRNAKDEF
ncbi:MAG: sigma-54-dependent Fis family transcriptional regulator [Planctomyces sp.]|nr:sigma-54-dependent Fis family transcriptional regulator [Planctomyces sp.]